LQILLQLFGLLSGFAIILIITKQLMSYNAYKARPDDLVNAQQLLSEKDGRISLIHL
jgi:hypothetical protein